MSRRTPGRRSRYVHSLIAVGLFLACASGCASTHLEPLTSQTEPALLGQDERALWATADRLEGQIAAHVEPAAGHEQAEQYLREIVQKLTPDFSNPNVRIRIRILPDPSPNAFILPNGAMYVNSGLLALLENEAQIATVLGHEFAHFCNRHSYREKIKEQNELVKGAILGSALGVLAGIPDSANSAAEIWRVSSVSGYSRELESEADHMSLLAVLRAGYRPEQAIKAFEQLQAVIGEDREQDRRFATHPRLGERIDSYRKCLREPEIQQQATGDRIADDVYNARLFDVILTNAGLNLDQENYTLAQTNIDRCLRLRPACAQAHFLRGEYLRNGPVPDRDPWRRAVECYDRALRCDPNCIEAHRELGLLHRYLGDRDKAGQSLRRYLEQAGDAPDAPLVRNCLETLADSNAVAPPLYRAPQLTAETLRQKARIVGVIPMFIPEDIPDSATRKDEFERALVEKLQQAGFTVVPSSAYEAIYESMKKAMGTLYDPNTGKPLEDRRAALVKHTYREYMATHRIDALAYPALVTVGAKWDMNRAEWHGVREATTGKEGFWANMAAPSAYGTIAALSFRMHVASVYGELCYLGLGGIQLCSRVVGNEFVDVPSHEILVDSARNTRSVDIACQTLLSGTK